MLATEHATSNPPRLHECFHGLDATATLDDLREAVTTLEDTVRIARRVLGGAHPLTEGIERDLQNAQAALAARDVEALRVGAMRV